MTPSALLQDQFRRILEAANRIVDGIPDAELGWRPDPGSNTIAWLVWHTARIQDDHVAHVAGAEQTWVEGAWARRFGLDAATMATGYGHTPEQVAAIRPGSATILVDYLSQVTERTLVFLDEVTADDLDRVVDDSWDPPVTLGVRLNSVLGDNWQHVGQAAHVRGEWDRR